MQLVLCKTLAYYHSQGCVLERTNASFEVVGYNPFPTFQIFIFENEDRSFISFLNFYNFQYFLRKSGFV